MSYIKRLNEIKKTGKSRSCLTLIDQAKLDKEFKDIDLELLEEIQRSALEIKQDLMQWEDIVQDYRDLLEQPSIVSLKSYERTGII